MPPSFSVAFSYIASESPHNVAPSTWARMLSGCTCVPTSVATVSFLTLTSPLPATATWATQPSGLPRLTDIPEVSRHASNVPILEVANLIRSLDRHVRVSLVTCRHADILRRTEHSLRCWQLGPAENERIDHWSKGSGGAARQA